MANVYVMACTAKITCFLVVLQVVSSGHSPSPKSIQVTDELWDTTPAGLTTLPTIETFPTTPETDSPSDNFTLPNSTETTTDVGSNATISTTVDDVEVQTIEYVSVSDEPPTKPAQTTPSPTKNMAVVLSQPGLLSLLPLAFGMISQLRWCR